MNPIEIWKNPRNHSREAIDAHFISLTAPELTEILKAYVEALGSGSSSVNGIHDYLYTVIRNKSLIHRARNSWNRLHYFLISIEGSPMGSFFWIRREPEVFLHYVITLDRDHFDKIIWYDMLMDLILATEVKGGSDWARRADAFLRKVHHEIEWVDRYDRDPEKKPRTLSVFECARTYRGVS